MWFKFKFNFYFKFQFLDNQMSWLRMQRDIEEEA